MIGAATESEVALEKNNVGWINVCQTRCFPGTNCWISVFLNLKKPNWHCIYYPTQMPILPLYCRCGVISSQITRSSLVAARRIWKLVHVKCQRSEYNSLGSFKLFHLLNHLSVTLSQKPHVLLWSKKAVRRQDGVHLAPEQLISFKS